MKKIISVLMLIVLITSTTQAFAVSGGGSIKKYSFGSSSSSESKNEPVKEEKEWPVQKGSKGEKVKKIQQLLIDLDFLTGTADGIFGNGTKESVMAFQSEKGLEATGAVDEETYEMMLIAVQIKNESAKYAFLDEMSREELIKLRDEVNIRLGEQPEVKQEDSEAVTAPTPIVTKAPTNTPKPAPKANSNNGSLTDIEEEIFEWLTNSISDFHSPASVRVVEILGMKDDMYYISISAETLGGGTSNELYELEKYSCKKSMFVTINKIKDTHFTLRDTIYGRTPYSSECDVGNINKALKDFCEEKGWN